MSMADRDGFIWKDGELIPWRDATTHVLTHSLHYGMAVFEGLRAYKQHDGSTAIFRLPEHTRRMYDSAKIFLMDIPYSEEELMAAQKQVVKANQLESCYIRPLIYFGSEKLGVSTVGCSVHVTIAAWPWGAYLGEDGIAKGIRVKTSSFMRHHINVTMCRAKASGNYMNSILANREATMNGYDEAILLDVNGYVAEGAGENIFIVKDGVLIEPMVTSGLMGITRRSIIDLARDLGIPFESRLLTRDDLYLADEVFFTGTAAEVTPIREVDDRKVGSGSRGPITEKLQTAFFDVVAGRNPKYTHWMARV